MTREKSITRFGGEGISRRGDELGGTASVRMVPRSAWLRH